jgi:hypothetical protein
MKLASRLIWKRGTGAMNVGWDKLALASAGPPCRRWWAGARMLACPTLQSAECRLLIKSALLAFVVLATSSAGAQEEAADPIGELALDMEQVVIDLSGMTTGEPVQDVQKQIVTKLDKLIEELEKESEQQRGGSSGANPMKPMADSMITGGPGGIGDLHAARKTGKQWADLPPHERDRIVQSMTEGFPAHYQKILERYYKRLAEETPAGTADDGKETSADPTKTKEKAPAKKPVTAKADDGKSATTDTKKVKKS